MTNASTSTPSAAFHAAANTNSSANPDAPRVCTLAAGGALSLIPRAPTALRITEGSAWVTLADGPHSVRGQQAAGDVFLHAGQTLWVATGQHAVVEPLSGHRLQYRLTGLEGSTGRATRAARVSASWWRRVLGGVAAVRPAASSAASAPDACCA
ncbi:DUF2917 domain-containing protein [Paracidovorax sp. MALMAid1276]|uniref:DUF2917 domain-containing protein n=1 Tax=Paracidovorax sp. MALMAid1276 TaxID=3411631 RepID=UPI003B98F425